MSSDGEQQHRTGTGADRPDTAKEAIMARTKTAASKSDRLRARLLRGEQLAEAARAEKMNYAFAYGVATRLADSNPEFNLRTVTAERATRKVRVLDSGTVIVTVPGGFVSVDSAGKVTRSKKNPA